MMQAQLSNGITLWYNADPRGRVVLRYPGGDQVQTSWVQVALIETMIVRLRQAYEDLLQRAGNDTDAEPAIEMLAGLDDLLCTLTLHRP